MSAASTIRDAPRSFEDDVRAAVGGLRRCLLEMFRAAGVEPTNTAEVHRSFGVDRKLGWQVARVAHDQNLFDACRHFPGDAAMARFLVAAGERGVEAGLIERAGEAARDLSAVIERHSGSRVAFDQMLAGLSAGASDQEELAQRRAAYSANGYLYGVRARVQLTTHILFPSATAGLVDVAVVRGFVDLWRVRSWRPWPVMWRRWSREDGSLSEGVRFEPIDPALRGVEAAPLLPAFCSTDATEVIASELDDGIVEYALAGSEIGKLGRTTCVLGEVARGAGPAVRTASDAHAELTAQVRTPVESLLFDNLVHRDLAKLGVPELGYASDVLRVGRPSERPPEQDALSPLATLESLGDRPAGRELADVPFYADLLESVLKMLGQPSDGFSLYRARLPHPALVSTAHMRYALPSS